MTCESIVRDHVTCCAIARARVCVQFWDCVVATRLASEHRMGSCDREGGSCELRDLADHDVANRKSTLRGYVELCDREGPCMDSIVRIVVATRLASEHLMKGSCDDCASARRWIRGGSCGVCDLLDHSLVTRKSVVRDRAELCGREGPCVRAMVRIVSSRRVSRASTAWDGAIAQGREVIVRIATCRP